MRTRRVENVRAGAPHILLLLFNLLLSACLATEARAQEPLIPGLQPAPAADDLRAYVDTARAVVILTRDDRPVAALQWRAAGEKPVPVELGKAWRKLPALKVGGRQVRPLAITASVRVAGQDTRQRVDLTLSVECVAGGMRLLVNPGPGPASAKEKRLAPRAEMAVSLFSTRPAAEEPDGPDGPDNSDKSDKPADKDDPATPKDGPDQKKKPAPSGAPQLTAADVFGPHALDGRPHELPDTTQPFRASNLSFTGRSSPVKKDEKAPPAPQWEMSRSAPVLWQLAEQGRITTLTQRLRAEPGNAGRLADYLLYIGVEKDVGRPDIGPVRLSKTETPAHDLVEGAVRMYASGADPFAYDEAAVMVEIAYPHNGPGEPPVHLLPCFFWEAPPPDEQARKAGAVPAEGEYRFRFAPPKPGTYGLRMLVIAHGRQVVRGAALAIKAGPPAGRGPVRVRAGEACFRYDDGGTFIPVGLNLCWPARRNDVDSMRRYFVELARHGGNASRIWLSSWGLPLEGPKAGRYDPTAAQALDDIFLAAQARDLHLILVAENAHDLTESSKDHPYFRENGGPLVASAEFFKDPATVKLFKQRLTYLAARYGAYRSLWAWELMNEVDEAWPAVKPDPENPLTPEGDADRSRHFRREVEGWASLVGGHLDGMDLHDHPICVSTALPPDAPWPGLEKAEYLSFVQQHGYIPEAVDARDDRALDGAAQVAAWANAFRQPGRARRPYLLGEFGYRALHDQELKDGGAEARARDRNVRDREGLLLHHALMASLASGMPATPMNWWWDRHVQAHDLWALFEGPSRFARALEQLSDREGVDGLRPLDNAHEANAGVRVLGRVGRRGQCVWIQDKRSTWARALETQAPPPNAIQDLVVKLPGVEAGTYRVRWLDPWRGEWKGESPLSVAAPEPPGAAPPALTLKPPAFTRDIALIIEPVKKKPSRE